MAIIAREFQAIGGPRAVVPQWNSRREVVPIKRVTRATTPPCWEEMWRQIYTPLFLQTETARPQTLAISSAIDGEGKTTVALGLAATMANDLNCSVLLLDCNLVNPSLSEALGLEDELGMANWLGLASWIPGEVSLDAVTVRTSIKNLRVVPSGPRVANPSRLIRSASLADLLQEARAKHDVIIMDTPSVLTSSDAGVLLSYSDAVLFVVRSGMCSTKALTKAMSAAEGVASRGIVVNDFQTSVPRSLQRFFQGN